MSKNPRQFRSISVEMGRIQGKQKDIFFKVIWLLHGQLWVIIEGAPSLTRC